MENIKEILEVFDAMLDSIEELRGAKCEEGVVSEEEIVEVVKGLDEIREDMVTAIGEK
jgi:hypothetical protein